MKTANVLVIVIACAVFYGLVGTSYFASANLTDDNMPQVLLQLQHRDSDGNLVSYVEGKKIVFLNPDKLDEFLDTLPNKKIIQRDGKRFELFQWMGPSEKSDKTHSYSGYNLRVLPVDGQYQTVMMVLYDAYQTAPGDTTTVRWTVMRPLD
ncbi:hypothetical protein [Candidatus Nitrosotenuis sp. DW1]|uniref:hypothetical protein n=1 Tax=Candidatus Nitrosotenuis sp. DW1 TaxID=2259672 RepID=UPI0015CC2E31|nr:hypothetical protein [Candidatus Nitrosotenuis sp. DW1]QLH09283.1 hypothetical protein DSQ19_07200 [Candidatus Nitrosotenuis sp. DW1]